MSCWQRVRSTSHTAIPFFASKKTFFHTHNWQVSCENVNDTTSWRASRLSSCQWHAKVESQRRRNDVVPIDLLLSLLPFFYCEDALHSNSSNVDLLAKRGNLTEQLRTNDLNPLKVQNWSEVWHWPYVHYSHDIFPISDIHSHFFCDFDSWSWCLIERWDFYSVDFLMKAVTQDKSFQLKRALDNVGTTSHPITSRYLWHKIDEVQHSISSCPCFSAQIKWHIDIVDGILFHY